MSIILDTPRLVLRELIDADVDALAAVYADPETMRFFNGPRSRDSTARQIEVCRRAYAQGGFAFWATIHKADDAFIGRCGLLPQSVEGTDELEVAYMIARPYWNNGLGTEVARGLRDYPFVEPPSRALFRSSPLRTVRRFVWPRKMGCDMSERSCSKVIWIDCTRWNVLKVWRVVTPTDVS